MRCINLRLTYLLTYITYGSLPKKVFRVFFQVIDIVDPTHIHRKYSSRQFLLSSKIDYRCGCHCGLEFLNEFDCTNVYLVSDW